jgi:death on curing protein
MRYLTTGEVLQLHRLIMAPSGSSIVRDLGALESSVAQPRMSFDGQDLYPAIVDKAAALGFALIMNHPFLDGNKRVGHAALETFLVLNGFEINASVDDQEKMILAVAAGETKREEFLEWLRQHVVKRETT